MVRPPEGVVLVVGAGQARQAVEKDEDLLALLRQSLGALDGYLGGSHVADRILVVAAGDHLAA